MNTAYTNRVSVGSEKTSPQTPCCEVMTAQLTLATGDVAPMLLSAHIFHASSLTRSLVHSSTPLSLTNSLKVKHRFPISPLDPRKPLQGTTLVLDRRMATPDSDREISATNDDGHEDGARPCDERLSCVPTSELPRQFYLLTHPRSGSNLLVHILNLEEQHVITSDEGGGYYFISYVDKMDEFNVRGKAINTWTQEQRAAIRSVADECYGDLARDIARLESEPGKTIFVKEHCEFLHSPAEHLKGYEGTFAMRAKAASPAAVETEAWILNGGSKSENNETLFTDEFLFQWMPTFLVRHPALAYPSHFRAAKDLGWSKEENLEDDEGLQLQSSLRWIRKLYDFYDEKLPETRKQYGGVDWPVVLTGDSVMTEPETVRRFAALARLNTDKLRFQWDSASKERVERNTKRGKRMYSTLLASTGIDRSKVADSVDIAAEASKWGEEFGDRAASKIEGWVRAAMLDYEYLKARRLRAEPMVADGRHV